MPPHVGPLELETLEVMWANGGWMTPGEVHHVLAERRGLAYTTVMSVMTNLWKKDVLERQRDGRAYAYHPVQSREERAAALMADALAEAGGRAAVLTNFVGRLDDAQRRQLRHMLGAR